MDFRHNIGIMKNILNNFQIHIRATGGHPGHFRGSFYPKSTKTILFCNVIPYSRSWRGSRVHFNWQKVWLLKWVVGTFRITKKSGPFFGLWSVPIFGPPGVRKGVKRGSKLPFYDKIITGDWKFAFLCKIEWEIWWWHPFCLHLFVQK